MGKKKYGWWECYFLDDYKTRCTCCGGEAPVSHDDGCTYAWYTPNVCPHCGAEMWEDIEQGIDGDGYEYIMLRRKYNEPIE